MIKNTLQENGKKRVLSGIRATGRLHLGNYLGAVKGMLELQDNPEYETLYCVVDLHATTTPYDPKTLKEKTREVYLDYLACGIDPEKSALYIQSDLADLIAQLSFYFSTATTVARMQHLPTFKDKVKQYPGDVTMALLNYPILMAADILIYKAGLVPVGIDQEPHLEIAREIARKMNDVYGIDFPEPVRFATKGEYVPSLAGVGKMSKSVEGSFINLTDDLETIKKRLADAPTNSGKGDFEIVPADENHPEYKMVLNEDGTEAKGVDSLLKFVELFLGMERRKEYEKMYTTIGIGYGGLKEELSNAIFEELKPIQEKRKYFEENKEEVDKIIKEGAQKARLIAEKTLNEVRQKMGFD